MTLLFTGAAMDGLQNVWYEGFSLGDDLLEVIVVGMSAQRMVMSPENVVHNINHL